MNKPLRLNALLLVSTAICFPSLADDSAEGDEKSWTDWFTDNGIELRKSFAGTVKDQSSPAQIAYFNPDGKDEFFNIDAALKVEAIELDKKKLNFRAYPVLEKHKSNNEQSKVDKESVAINTEADVFVGDSFILTNLNYAVSRDKQNDITTRSTALFATYSWSGDFAFGRTTLIGKEWELYYLPSIGYEQYDNLPIEEKLDGVQTVIAEAVDENFQVARVEGQIKPYFKKLDSKLVINFAYTKRWLVGSADVVPGTTDFTEIAVTYYIDDKKSVGVALNYTNGQSPGRNFLDEENSSVGLNIKF